MRDLKVGADIGGTFTDVVVIDEHGERHVGKTLTTTSEPEVGVLLGLEQAIERSGQSLASVSRVIHGTTLATNALIERRGAKTALLTTEGFRDQLEISTEGRHDSYDLLLQRAQPLVPRHLRLTVSERVFADGSVVTPLDEGQVVEIARVLEAKRVEALAVSFLHSYRNSAHEERARCILQDLLPDLPVSISSEVDPQIREYQRTSTTVANAYTQPAVGNYLRRLAEGLSQRGVKGDLLIMTSSGGVCSVDAAIRFPARILESGPVGAVQAGIFHTRDAPDKDLVVFDMGGTTAKASLVRNGRALTSSEFEASRSQRLQRGSGLPVRAPVVDLIEIGAGGGSIATINKLGFVQVGPTSAGADPGPACYGQGGSAPTVTDADLILGYVSPTRFLGGRMALDLDAAKRTVYEHIARPLSLDLFAAAWSIHRIVNEMMASAVRVHSTERGEALAGSALFALGGAGPVHACNVANLLNARRVVSPTGAGVASAFGFLCAPVSFESVRSHFGRVDTMNWDEARQLVAHLTAEGAAILKEAGCTEEEAKVALSCDMRYSGQTHEIRVPLTVTSLDDPDPQTQIVRRFEEAYQRAYGACLDVPIFCLNWRVSLTGPDPDVPRTMRSVSEMSPVAIEERDAYFPELQGVTSVPVFRRIDLDPGHVIDGPAIFEEEESTFVVAPGFHAELDPNANLIATRR